MFTILCFGDSNTWGCPPFANIAQTPDRIPLERRWPQIMRRALGDQSWVIEEGLPGRTTVFDDPIEGIHKNATRTLVPILETHSPLDVLIVMLGTNDFKDQLTITAFNSARGMLTLIQLIKGHYALVDRGPEILLVTPPLVSEKAEPAIWGDAWRRCTNHAYYLEQVAQRTGCFHFDSNRIVSVGIDGIHMEESGHADLGKALAIEVERIISLRNPVPIRNPFTS